jgi:hypothetical protein
MWWLSKPEDEIAALIHDIPLTAEYELEVRHMVRCLRMVR